MYVDRKDASQYTTTKDSSSYFYAGYGADIKKVYSTLQVPFADSTLKQTWAMVAASKGASPVIKPETIRAQVMPNVRGMGLKDALFLLENMGVKVNVKGRGKIVSQSIAPGTQLNKGVIVMLELS